MSELPNRACIIGAGSSGITACKVLKDHGIPFDCYEAGDRVGGNWVYNNSNPFFRPEVYEAKNNDLPLYYHVFPPQYRDLFFIGFVQPLGAIMPLAELQSVWVSRYLIGKYGLPSTREMLREIDRTRREMRKRYGSAPRHTIQVDVEPYVGSIRKEMRRSKDRPATPLIAPDRAFFSGESPSVEAESYLQDAVVTPHEH